MKRSLCIVFVSCCLCLVCGGSARAAQILGTVRAGGNAGLANAEIQVRCGAGQPHVTRTDQFGSYSVYVRETGKCTFAVAYNGRMLSADVYSYADPAHADFDVVKDQNGNPMLRRR